MSEDPRIPSPFGAGPEGGVRHGEHGGDRGRAGPNEDTFRDDLFTATPRAFVTHLLIAANIAVFAMMVVNNPRAFLEPSTAQMIHFGAGYGPLTTRSQPWRLFTEMFVHFGIIHIGMNLFVLWQGGPLVERLFGNFAYLVIYIFSGLVGSYLSLRAHPFSVAAGASGAIFGVYGALLGYLVIQRGTVPQTMLRSLLRYGGLFVVYNLAFGMAVPGIDMYAHGGGVVGGFVLGMLLSRRLVPGANLVRTLVVAAVGCAAVYYLFGHLPPAVLPPPMN